MNVHDNPKVNQEGSPLDPKLAEEIAAMRQKAMQLTNQADRWRCLLLLKHVEEDLLSVKHRRILC